MLLKVAHLVLDAISPDADLPPISELCARVKDTVPVGISYDGRDITKAMDSALAQRRIAAQRSA